MKQYVCILKFFSEFLFPDLYTIFSPGWQIRYHNSVRIISKAGAVPGSSAAIILMPEQRFGKNCNAINFFLLDCLLVWSAVLVLVSLYLGFLLLATGQEIVPRLAEEISLKLTKTFSSNLVLKSLEVNHVMIMHCNL